MASVARPSPKELGLLLGLEQGLDGRAVDLLTCQALGDSGLADQLIVLFRLSTSESWDYWQTFALLYLPSFLRTFLGDRSGCEVEFFASFSWFAHWAALVMGTPAVARFIRLHPEESRDHFLSYLRILASIDLEFLKAASFPEEEIDMVLQVSMGCFMTFFTALIDHLPNPVDLPCPPSVIQNLRRLLTTVKSRMNADEVPAVAFVLFVSRLGDDTVFSPLSLNEDRQIWWKCDVTRGEGAQSCDVQSGCAAIGSSDLEMCAQCQCVRYCGRAHQKTDWKKRHRAVCTKPSW